MRGLRKRRSGEELKSRMEEEGAGGKDNQEKNKGNKQSLLKWQYQV